MEINSKSLILSVIVIGMMYVISNSRSNESNDILNQELIQKEAWLIDELNNIAVFMQLPDGQANYVTSSHIFLGNYVSTYNSLEKLQSLYQLKLEEGWIDATESEKVKEYRRGLAYTPEKVLKNTYMLCKNNASLIIYMLDTKEFYRIKNVEMSTAVELNFASNLPCYNFKQ